MREYGVNTVSVGVDMDFPGLCVVIAVFGGGQRIIKYSRYPDIVRQLGNFVLHFCVDGLYPLGVYRFLGRILSCGPLGFYQRISFFFC